MSTDKKKKSKTSKSEGSKRKEKEKKREKEKKKEKEKPEKKEKVTEVKLTREEKSNFILLQPGSQNLRVGLSSSTEPFVVPHCIARLRKKTEEHSNDEKQLVGCHLEPKTELHMEFLKEVEKDYPMQENKTVVYDANNCAKELTAKNPGAINSRLSKSYPTFKEDISRDGSEDDILVAEDVLKLLPSDPYFIYYPFRFGYVNKSENQSIHSVECNLEILWKTVISARLKIRVQDFQDYPLLIIPDMFQKSDLILICRVLFQKLKFPSIFIQRESVCTSVSVGKLTSCIVDIGHTKTSISCVDNGEIILGTSFHMNFGGSNVTYLLSELFQKHQIPVTHENGESTLTKNFGGHYFPLMKFNLDTIRDYNVMQTIKETCCHLNKKVHLQSKMFNLFNNHNGEGMKYTLNLSSIALLSAYSLFSPEFSMKVPHFITEYQQTQKLKRPSKRKFESTLEVQWGEIDDSEDDTNRHIPFTEGSILHSDTFGMDFMNRSSSPWVPTMKQRQTDEKPKSQKKNKKRKKVIPRILHYLSHLLAMLFLY